MKPPTDKLLSQKVVSSMPGHEKESNFSGDRQCWIYS